MDSLKDFLCVIGAIAVTVLCWGSYGPVLREGSAAMGHDRWRAFLCVGMAYFVIAVVLPAVLIYSSGDSSGGHWTTKGVLWSFAAGTVGAIGALGIIVAFNFNATPHYVMSMVFGCAPIVSAFVSAYLSGAYKEINPKFLAGLVIIAVGAVMVTLFAPRKMPVPKVDTHAPAAVEQSEGS